MLFTVTCIIEAFRNRRNCRIALIVSSGRFIFLLNFRHWKSSYYAHDNEAVLEAPRYGMDISRNEIAGIFIEGTINATMGYQQRSHGRYNTAQCETKRHFTETRRRDEIRDVSVWASRARFLSPPLFADLTSEFFARVPPSRSETIVAHLRARMFVSRISFTIWLLDSM